MKKLTKRNREITENLNPRCEDCAHYKESRGRMMCHFMEPFLASKETQRLRPRSGVSMNCGTAGHNFTHNAQHQVRAVASRPECGCPPIGGTP